MNPYVWSDSLFLVLAIIVIFIAGPLYWSIRRLFPAKETKTELRSRIEFLENKLIKERNHSEMLNGALAKATDTSDAYEDVQTQLIELREKLSDVEIRYAAAEKEIEFWRCKDKVTAAADIYYTLCLDYKDEIARFGSVLSWVDHLKSIYDQVKPIAGMIQNDDDEE